MTEHIRSDKIFAESPLRLKGASMVFETASKCALELDDEPSVTIGSKASLGSGRRREWRSAIVQSCAARIAEAEKQLN